MPKKKKTREQKMRSDHRREVSNTALYSFTAKTPERQAKPVVSSPKTTTHTISTTSYNYLSSDLRKTALFTGGVILLELIISFFVKGV
jgi:hypothetical protein